jgi:hypothetical protein
MDFTLKVRLSVENPSYSFKKGFFENRRFEKECFCTFLKLISPIFRQIHQSTF